MEGQEGAPIGRIQFTLLDPGMKQQSQRKIAALCASSPPHRKLSKLSQAIHGVFLNTFYHIRVAGNSETAAVKYIKRS
ncbi:hypothetical protein E2C01_075438 [Portunus trituberculatus]|uniref:Uncharacterized protein n=1 Tax=Portunus trituberculatus TaxID=210409 RepID=A0A5B7IF29_PORTR|nr:hypothetical protein [Portunus trituberculatus]